MYALPRFRRPALDITSSAAHSAGARALGGSGRGRRGARLARPPVLAAHVRNVEASARGGPFAVGWWMLATPHGAMDAAMAAGAATAGAYWTQGFADALFVPLSATVFSDYGVSATRTGIILAVSQLSSLLLTAPASVLADAYDCHRSTYIAARVLYAFAAGCMPLLLWLYTNGPLAHVGPACWAALLLVVMTLQGTFKSQAMALLDANVLAVLEPLGLRTHYGRVRLFTSLGRATGAVCGGPIYAELGGELFGGRLAATAWFAGSVVLALLGPFQHFALGSKCAKLAAVEDAEAPLLAPVADSGNVDSDDDGGADADVDVSRRRERVPSIADPVEAAAAVAELISRPVVLDDDDGADVMVQTSVPTVTGGRITAHTTKGRFKSKGSLALKWGI